MSETEQHRARNLLRALSYQVEKVFRQRGCFNSYLWLAEWSETAAQPPNEVDDSEVLAMLRAEQREDFREMGVVAFAVAFPAWATTVLRQSILHLAGGLAI